MPGRKKSPVDYRIGLGCLFSIILFLITIGLLTWLVPQWTSIAGTWGWLTLAGVFIIPITLGFVIAFRFRSPKTSIKYPDNWDELRERVYKRDEYRCQNCGISNVKLHCHHIVPLNKGGTNNLSNLITLCEDCHAKVHPGMAETKH